MFGTDRRTDGQRENSIAPRKLYLLRTQFVGVYLYLFVIYHLSVGNEDSIQVQRSIYGEYVQLCLEIVTPVYRHNYIYAVNQFL